MCGTEELNVGRKEDIVADRDLATVQDHTVKVHIDRIAHGDVASIVRLEGRLDPAALADATAGHGVEKSLAFEDTFGRALGGVVDLHQFTDAVAFEKKELVHGVVDF